ncbi:cytochrome b6-f complex subunit PetL [Cylindrospermum sp. FACHB-282]|nr:cytochrome b6-f complex subunit PetL [Cylindrospermum sp. FACHB-282]MBD2387266.1 cytochrome b6-f complex subunit PetL [Cylindrospermum sp. FACHB-282]
MFAAIAYVVYLGVFLGLAVGLLFGLRAAKII